MEASKMDMGCCEEESRNRNTKGDSSEGRVGRSVGGLGKDRQTDRDLYEEHAPSFSLKKCVYMCACFC